MQFHGIYRSPQRMYSSVAGIFFFSLLSAMKERNCGILKDAEAGGNLYNQDRIKEKRKSSRETGRKSIDKRRRRKQR